MTPLDRIDWAAAVAADDRLRASAYRIAPFLAKAFDVKRGVVAYSTETIARELGMARSTAQVGLYSLSKRGWLVAVGAPSKGRCATAYKLVRAAATDRESGQSRSQATDRDSSRLKAQQTENRVGKPTDQPTDQPTGNPGTIMGIMGDHGMIAPSDVALVADGQLVGPVFLLQGGQHWRMTKAFFEKLVSAFPNIDVVQTLAHAALWCETHPSRRKRPAGIMKFITGWMGRDRVTATPAEAQATVTLEPSAEAREIARRIAAQRPKGEQGNAMPFTAGEDRADAV